MKCNPRFLILCLSLGCLHGARADSPDSDRSERERIRAEQAKVEATFAARERECRDRFVVTSCIDEARRERRQAMESLRRQQELLDEAQRKLRAAQRVEEIRNKVSSEEAKRRDAEARQRERALQQAEAAASAASEPASTPAHAKALPARQAREKVNPDPQRASDYAKRQAAAQEHREAVAKRNAERAAKGKKPAKPLPAPSAASGG